MHDPKDELAFLSEAFGKVGEVGAKLARVGLQKINLGDPTEYVLKFVSSAVLGGASFLDIRTDADDFVLEYDGSPLSQGQLQGLSAGLVRKDTPANVHRMAAALVAALQAEVATVVVQSWTPSGGFELTVEANGHKLKALDRPPFRNERARLGVHLKEQGRLRKVTKLVTKYSGQLPEASVIERRCAFAPTVITLNGGPVDRTVDLGDCLVWRHLARAGGEPGFKPVAPRQGIRQEIPASGSFSAVLALKANAGDWAGLTLVVDGVTFKEPADLGFSSACVVATAQGLELDQNLERPARNPAYQELLTALRQELDLMAMQLVERAANLPSHEALAAAVILDDLARRTQDSKRLESVLKIIVALRDRHLRPTDDLLLESRMRLADLVSAQGRGEEAAELYERVIPILEGQAQNHLNKHRHEEAVQAQARALELLERVRPEGDPDLGTAYHELAEVCREHRHPRAEALYRRAVAIRERRAAEEPLELAQSLYGLADIYRRQKMLAEAEEVGKRSLELMEQIVGTEHKDLVPYLKLMSQVLDAMGDYAGSTDHQRRAMMLKYKR